MELGILKGEPCNRYGCAGIIEEHDSDGGCSCHIAPPCSYCETPREYCPECDWDASDEKLDFEREYTYRIPQEIKDDWAKERKSWEDARNIFYNLFYSKEPVTELNYRTETHSNSSMKVFGMYPPGTEITMDKIRGTFGGRFEHNNKERGRFIYIAYTD